MTSFSECRALIRRLAIAPLFCLLALPGALGAESTGLSATLLPAAGDSRSAQLAVDWGGTAGARIDVELRRADQTATVLLTDQALTAGVNLLPVNLPADVDGTVHMSVQTDAGSVVETVAMQSLRGDSFFAWESMFTGPGLDEGASVGTGGVRATVIWDDGDGPALYVGGGFVTAGAHQVNRIARWDGDDWSPLTGPLGTGIDMDGSGNPSVRALTVFEGDLIVAGFFDNAGGVAVNNIARWDGSEWSALGVGLSGSVGVNVLTTYNGALIAGGIFTQSGDATVNRVARWDGAQWTSLGTGISGAEAGQTPQVHALGVYNGELIAGGNFIDAGGIAVGRIARWNGSVWAGLGAGVSEAAVPTSTLPSVNALTVMGSDLIVGGNFRRAGGTPAGAVARWNGSAWSAIGTGMTGEGNVRVHALALFGSELVAGGSFATADGNTVNHIATWNGSQWSALSGPAGAGVGSAIETLAVFDGYMVAAGVGFSQAGGVAANSIARWNGTVWSTLDGEPGSGIRGDIAASTIYNGDLVVAGNFGRAGGALVHSVARWDGSAWQAFDGPFAPGIDSPPGAGVSPSASALAVFDGELILGGRFLDAGGIFVNHIARWDGTRWWPLGPDGSGVTGGSIPGVRALAVHDGALIVAGQFTTAGGVGASNIARWDGSTWSALGSGTAAAIESLTVFDGALIAGGNFTTAGGQSAARIARWDGSAWSALGGGVNGIVYSMTAFGGDLIAVGNFTLAAGQAVSRVARWDGSAWSGLTGTSGITGVNGQALAVTEYAGELFVGGRFAEAGGLPVNFVARWNGSDWLPLVGIGGAGVGGWSSPTVRTLVVADFDDAGPEPAKLVAGGRFHLTGGIGNWNLGVYGPGAALSVLDVTPGNIDFGTVLAGWVTQPETVTLSSIGSAAVSVAVLPEAMAPFERIGGSCPPAPFDLPPPATCTLEYQFAPVAHGDFSQSFLIDTNSTLAAAFTLNGSGLIEQYPPTIEPAPGSLALTLPAGQTGSDTLNVGNAGDQDLDWQISEDPATSLPTFGDDINAMTVWDDGNGPALYAAGADGSGFHGIARWDGSAWSALGVGMDHNVESLTVYDGDLVAGGRFDRAGGMTVNRIARWDGTRWTALDAGVSGSSTAQVLALTVFNGDLIAGGSFTNASGVEVAGIARWDGSQWSALAGGLTTQVFALAVHDGALIAAGNFTTVGGQTFNRVARWDGSAWSPLGSGVDSSVLALTLFDGALIAGGSFSNAGGQPANRLARWDGSQWSALGAGVNTQIGALTVSGNDLIAAGLFSEAGGVPAGNIARWDGSAWSALGAGTGGRVSAVAALDGGVFAGGTFSQAGGMPIDHIARWDGSAWSAVTSGPATDCTMPDWLDASPTDGSVAGGASQPVAIGFDSAGLVAGDYAANLCLASNDPGRPVAVVPVALTVGGVGTPQLAFDPTSLNFGEVPVGVTSPPDSATLLNTGGAAAPGLSFNDIAGSGFAVDTDDCGTVLAAGDSCEVVITFTPPFEGPIQPMLVASTPGFPPALLQLLGTGVAPMDPPAIEVDPDSLSATVPEHGSDSQVLSIANLGQQTLDWNVTETPDVLLVEHLGGGDEHTCAVVGPEGSLYCWGRNWEGQLGNGSSDQNPHPLPVAVVDPDQPAQPLAGIVRVDGGAAHTCALTVDSTVLCWGFNGAGRLGTGDEVSSTLPRYVVAAEAGGAPLSGVVDISVGNLHTCVRMVDGTARCWGYNFWGQLGNQSTSSSSVPVPVVDPAATTQPLSGLEQVVAGNNHSCARDADGGAWCWGWNIAGQVGNGSTTPGATALPSAVVDPDQPTSPLAGVTWISAGNIHSCALTSPGLTYCWGQNAHGQLGNGDAPNNSPVPSLVVDPDDPGAPLAGIVQVTAGGLHVCALTDQGTGYCWGSNESGQLGTGTTDNSAVPVLIADPAVPGQAFPMLGDIDPRQFRTCATTLGGIAYCWGDNGLGQLGDGTTQTRHTPTPVEPGAIQSCALPGWLDTVPANGSVAGGESMPVEVGFDATGLAIGDYMANLCIASNDPAQPLTTVPVLLTVDANGVGSARLIGSAGVAGDNFGDAVAIDGDYAVVGAFLADPDGNVNEGAAYVFTRSTDGWIEQVRLVPSDYIGYLFGRSVAIDGDTVVVGAVGADVDGVRTGAAYVFTRSGDTWSQQAKLAAADGGPGNEFGRSVAIDGDTVLVGAHSAHVGDNNAQGAAYVFTRTGDTWSQTQKLLATDGASFHSFGNAVAMDGDVAVIGAHQASFDGLFWNGAAYVFARDGGAWSQQVRLLPVEGAAFDQFGHAVAVSGDTVVVSTQLAIVGGNTAQGAAHVFVRDGDNWPQQARLTSSDGAANDQFGSSVAVRGDLVLVGAAQQGSTIGVDLDAGAGYLFKRDGVTWSEQGKLRAPDGLPGDHFGMAVGLGSASGGGSADRAVVGAPGADVGDNVDQGVAYVIALAEGGLQLSPEALDFDDVPVGEPSAAQTVMVTNTGTADVEFGTLLVTGADAAAFAISADDCSEAALAPQQTCSFATVFTPSALGAHAAQVKVPSDAPATPHQVPLSGQGVTEPPQIGLDPESLSASVASGGTGSETLIIANLGSEQALTWEIVEDAGLLGTLRRPLGDVTPVPVPAGNGSPDRGGFITDRGEVDNWPAQPAFAPRGSGTITLSHSTSMEIVAGNSIACGDNQTGFTRENHFLRTFTLADFGIQDSLEVDEVSFGIENLTVATDVTVGLYTLDGPFVFTNLTLLSSEVVSLEAQQGQLLTVPITASVPADTTLVMVVHAPDLLAAEAVFMPGSNPAGESAPSYIAASDCDAPEPVTLASTGNGHVHWVMAVTGTTSEPLACALPDWLDTTPQDGSIAPLGIQQVTVGFDAAALAVGRYDANLCIASNDPQQPLSVVPVALTVTEPGAPDPAVLVAGDGAASDWFGRAIAIDGDTALVGADAADIGGIGNQGAVYVFQRVEGGWIEQAKLTADDGAQFDQFGIDVSLSGDTAVIGSAGDAAYVFVRDGTTWSQQALLIGSDTTTSDTYGIAVAVDGDTAVVGAREADVDGRMNQGAAYVFTRSGATWSEQAKLTAGDGLAFDLLGDAVAIDGDTVVAGAAFADPGGNDAQGAAYVFVRNGTSWSEQDKLLADDGSAGHRFGDAVAVSADTIVVGASLVDGNLGAAYTFVRSGGDWSQQARLSASDAPAGALFGDAVTVQGDVALIGALFADGHGAAYVFDRDGSAWSERIKLVADGIAPGDQLGNAVALDGDTALVAAWQTDVDGNANQGVVHVFELEPGGGPGEGELTLTPETFDFGIVPAGITAGPVPMTLTNTGDGGLTVTAIDIAEAPFARTGGTCAPTPFDLAPGADCTLDYLFAPMSVGSFEQVLAIASDGGSVELTLSGTGVAVIPSELVVLGGDGQSTAVGTPFAEPLAVQVRDAFGNPVPGIEITFAAPATGASAVLSAAAVTTDANGYAAVTATANDTAGSYVVTVDGGFGAPVAFALSNVAASVDVSVAIVASRDYVRPGQMLDYVVTLSNAGPDVATDVSIASVLAPSVDLAFASWQCLGPDSSGCTDAGTGNLADNGLSVPAGGSVTYLLSAPVHPDAEEDMVETAINASTPGDSNPGNDSAIASSQMVLFRDGFQAYGDGAAAEPLTELTGTLGVADTVLLIWPNAADTWIRDVLVAKSMDSATANDAGADGQKHGFRIEHLNVAGSNRARLVVTAANGGEQATAWIPVEPASELALAFVDSDGDDERRRTFLLVGTGVDVRLTMIHTGSAGYRLWAAALARIESNAE